MVSNYNSGQIRVAGKGDIWAAPLGTPYPTDSTTALNAAFVNLGYATNGFEMTQEKKTKEIVVWQSLEPARLVPIGMIRKFKFELQQTNKATLGLAWGGVVVPVAGAAVGGSVTIGTGGVLTTSTAHGLSVGAAVTLATVTGSTGVVALTTYYVVAVGSTVILTLAATAGGTALTTTAGSATGLSLAGAYAIQVLDQNLVADRTYVIEWQDGLSVSQRIVIPQGTVLTMPMIKSVRDDSTAYMFEIQAIKPADGSSSVQPFGVDVATAS
jgi:hypothetical protein